MPKVIRFRTEGLYTAQGAMEIPLEVQEGDVYVNYYCDCQATLYALDTEGKMYPLHNGLSCDQTFNFKAEISHLVIQPIKKDGRFCFRVLQAGTKYRDMVDPTPKTVPLPLDNNSLQSRVLRMVSQALEAHGIDGGASRGHAYPTEEDEENYDDEEFGPGYAVSAQLEQEIEHAVRNDLAKRLRQSSGDGNSDNGGRSGDNHPQPKEGGGSKSQVHPQQPGSNNTPSGSNQQPNPSATGGNGT